MTMMTALRDRMVALVYVAACAHDPGGDTDPGTTGGTETGGDACVIPPDGLPDDVFCTGLYLNRDASQIADDVMPYTPGVTLWSDGAEKARYLYLPPSTTIDTTDMDGWSFPVGNGRIGDSASVTGTWSSNCNLNCQTALRFYCFEQAT